MSDVSLLPRIARVVVGSTNPVKVGAVRAVLERCTTSVVVYGVAVSSGVPDQPWGDDETRAGAIERAEAALATDQDADFGAGIEGGVVREADGTVRTCAWAAIVDRAGVTGVGGSLAMPLPPAVVTRLEQGMELGHAMDAVVQTSNIKQGRGAVGVLTGNLLTRQQAYEPLVSYALARWIASDLWSDPAR